MSMSNKGGLHREKHGRPHEETHENGLDVNIDINDSFQIKNELLDVNTTSTNIHSIQDGDERIGGKIVTSENLSFLSTDDLDSYEREVVENNTEWLKSRCRNLETVDFDIPSSESDGVGDLFGSDPDDSGLPLCTDASSLASEIQLMTKNVCQASVISVPSLDNGVLGVQSSCNSLDLPDPGEDGAIGINDKGLDSLGISGDKNNTLMTPQELESMPDRGLEFEESVGPKSDGVPSSDMVTLDHVGSSHSLENVCQRDADALKTGRVIRIEPNGQVSPMSGIVNQNGTQDQIPASLLIGDTVIPDQANLKLATISISTDKISNSTQILVNTNQGQQLYHINTADLAQATNAIEPLSRNQKKESPTKTPQTFDNLPAGTQTGYLILPVQSSDIISNGILLSMPVGGIEGNNIPQNVDGAEVPGIPRKVYICSEQGCDKVFKKISKFKIHQMQHTGERPFKCSKDGCDWAFTTLYKLKRHEESHEGRKDYFGCGWAFTTASKLKRHQAKHTGFRKWNCGQCGKAFMRSEHLKGHMITHSGVKPYACPVEDSIIITPTTTSQPSEVISKQNIDPLEDFIVNAADSGVVTRVIQENWSGSARTDYRSNHLSEKGRKRQQLLKDNALSAINLDSSSFQDPSEENFIVPTSAVSFSPPENLSRGITFRDPETGVLYVQTQLLQDDPPNPELYPDEHVLASDLSSLNDSVGSEQSLSDIEFTGSTINLQDLA
ncbi:hypothetical protein KUTeg_023477 [Tegillarca granosa]|uniref:C2H2-type domain-containing protein n=1 Tax=Tegillarca granosa TaxID=220873 RepID=A0ABQ9E6C4_TEGGR|nr:hypothetical protein KUTeg_023477 [Tegillarca granosa]